MTKIQFIIGCFAIFLISIFTWQIYGWKNPEVGEKLQVSSTTEKIIVPLPYGNERHIFITTYNSDGIEYKVFHTSEGLVVINHTKEKLHVQSLNR